MGGVIAAPFIVYVVMTDTEYDPPSLISIWISQELAEKECERLRSVDNGQRYWWDEEQVLEHEGCQVRRFSSRACEYGTRGCEVRHA